MHVVLPHALRKGLKRVGRGVLGIVDVDFVWKHTLELLHTELLIWRLPLGQVCVVSDFSLIVVK